MRIWYWLRWICVFVWCFDPNIILLFVFPFCWMYISPSSGCWSPTSLWCRLAYWGRLVDVSSRGRLGAYSSFYALILESCLVVLWLGCWGFLFMFRIYLWGTIVFILIKYMRFDIWLYIVWDVISVTTDYLHD